MELNNIGSRVGVLSRLFLKRINENIFSTGITGSQWSLIRRLDCNGPLTQIEICKLLSIEASTASTMIQAMEKKQLISRSAEGKDKREKKVKLTDKARECMPIWHEMVYELQQQSLHNIPVEDVEIFECVLDKIIQNLKKEHNYRNEI